MRTSRTGSPSAAGGTRASAVWTGVAVASLLGVLLLVFILQNTTRVPVHFLGAHGHFPLAIGLLVAAVAGACIVLIPGIVRIAQLRRRANHELGRRPPTDESGFPSGIAGS